jgi:hypothetical protein
VSGDKFTFEWDPDSACVCNFIPTWSFSDRELRLSDVSCGPLWPSGYRLAGGRAADAPACYGSMR